MKRKGRIRLRLLVLLWIWGMLMFVVVDLFRNVSEFDSVRPRARTYRAMRYAAHKMVGESYHDGDFFREAIDASHVDRARPLRRALRDADAATDYDALVRLAQADGDARVRIRALRRLATEHGRRAQTLLLDTARGEAVPEKVRAEAARYLGRTGDGVLAGLDDLLTAASPRVRKGVLLGYAELGTAPAVRVLVEQGADEALARVANPAAVPVLAEAAPRSIAACRALGNLRVAEAVAPLIGVLADRGIHPTIRAAAAEALGRVGHRDGLEAVERSRGDPHAVVVAAAQRARSRIMRQ